MKKIFLITIVASLVLLGHGVANASLLFFDDFDTEHGGVGILNYNSFTKWAVTNGTVDLIGNGFYDFLPGNGLYVDLDGSTRKAGQFATKTSFNLTPGIYELSFRLAGNHRGGNESVTAQLALATLYNELFVLPSSAPFTSYTRRINVTTPTTGTLSFQNAGGDNIGALLDNVKLSVIPEPATLSLLGLGLLGLLGLRKRRVSKVVKD